MTLERKSAPPPPDEPVLDIAHLGHVELLTPEPARSFDFFVNVLGMTESGRRGDSVYLLRGPHPRRKPGGVRPLGHGDSGARRRAATRHWR